MRDAGPIEFQEVLAAEYAVLRPESNFVCADLRELHARVHREPHGLSALCLSGGGIRSATFGLGVLQGLAGRELLGRFDYLSTVSGGGFIGGWLSAWSNRAGGLTDVVAGLRPDAGAPATGTPDPIAHLRDYNSYMSPRLGMLSIDSWALIATILRNLLLNWLVLLPLLMAALMLPRIYLSILALPEWFFGKIIFAGSPPGPRHYGASELDAVSDLVVVHYGLPAVCAILLATALFNTLRFLPGAGNIDHSRADYYRSILLPLVGAVLAYLAFDSLYYLGEAFSIEGSLARQVLAALVPSLLAWILFLLVSGASARTDRMRQSLPLAVFVMGAGTGLASWISVNHLLWSPNPDKELSWPEYVTFAPPAIVLGYALGTVLFVGLSSHFLRDEDREWMSRNVASLLVFCFTWLLLCGTVLLVPKWTIDWQSWAPHVLAVVGTLSAWTSAFGAAMLARSAPPDPQRPGAIWSAAAMAVRIAPIAFALALAVALVLLTNAVLSAVELLPILGAWPEMQLRTVTDGAVSWSQHYAVLGRAHPLLVLATGFVLLALSFLFARFVNVNTFSLHGMYRDRLVRAYLGASNNKRSANRFTGFARNDDIPMHTLDPRCRPLHVVNLTLNLVQANRLAWQQRKAQTFTVTAQHCGNFELGYRPTAQYGGPAGLSLGTAMAISGAAASPSMGSHSSPVIGFVMTLLNARLGCWLGNPGPAGARTWKYAGPRSPIRSLVNEAFGLTSNQNPYVYLSDGGHFENLGLYEMVLRRCRHIIVVDAGCDPDLSLDDLGNALRKIRIDQGITITFDDAQMRQLRQSSSRCAVATITYSARDDGAADGRLLYIKPMLRGNEPADVENYGHTHPAFPHQSSAHQSFDEAQTESYRMLGLHSMLELCQGWVGGTLADFFDHVAESDPAHAKPGSRMKDGLPRESARRGAAMPT